MSEKFTREDVAKMSRNLEDVKGILFAGEVNERLKEGGEEETGKEINLMQSQEILNKEAWEQVKFLNKEFEKFVNDQKEGIEAQRFIKETYRWSNSEFDAMADVLRHGLRVLEAKFESQDELDKEFRAGGARDLKKLMYYLVAQDYSPEVADKASPLFDLYFNKVSEISKRLADEKTRIEKTENPPEGEETAQS